MPTATHKTTTPWGELLRVVALGGHPVTAENFTDAADLVRQGFATLLDEMYGDRLGMVPTARGLEEAILKGLVVPGSTLRPLGEIVPVIGAVLVPDGQA